MARPRLDHLLPVPPNALRSPAATVLQRAAVHAVTPTSLNLALWACCAVALGIELGLVLILREGDIFGWEQSLTRVMQDVPGERIVFEMTSPPTNTISAPFVLLFATLTGFVILSRHRWAALMLLLSFPLHVLAQFPKALVDRPRPSAAFDGIEGVGGLQSFPSGHAEYVITFYGFLAYLLVLHARHRAQRVAIIVAWAAFALATGFGRIAEGRHWPLDVLASYVVGFGLLAGLVWLHDALTAAEAELAPAATV